MNNALLSSCFSRNTIPKHSYELVDLSSFASSDSSKVFFCSHQIFLDPFQNISTDALEMRIESLHSRILESYRSKYSSIILNQAEKSLNEFLERYQPDYEHFLYQSTVQPSINDLSKLFTLIKMRKILDSLIQLDANKKLIRSIQRLIKINFAFLEYFLKNERCEPTSLAQHYYQSLIDPRVHLSMESSDFLESSCAQRQCELGETLFNVIKTTEAFFGKNGEALIVGLMREYLINELSLHSPSVIKLLDDPQSMLSIFQLLNRYFNLKSSLDLEEVLMRNSLRLRPLDSRKTIQIKLYLIDKIADKLDPARKVLFQEATDTLHHITRTSFADIVFDLQTAFVEKFSLAFRNEVYAEDYHHSLKFIVKKLSSSSFNSVIPLSYHSPTNLNLFSVDRSIRHILLYERRDLEQFSPHIDQVEGCSLEFIDNCQRSHYFLEDKILLCPSSLLSPVALSQFITHLNKALTDSGQDASSFFKMSYYFHNGMVVELGNVLSAVYSHVKKKNYDIECLKSFPHFYQLFKHREDSIYRFVAVYKAKQRRRSLYSNYHVVISDFRVACEETRFSSAVYISPPIDIKSRDDSACLLRKRVIEHLNDLLAEGVVKLKPWESLIELNNDITRKLKSKKNYRAKTLLQAIREGLPGEYTDF